MTCKKCINHNKCDNRGTLMLSINDLFELIYHYGVDRSCPKFKELKKKVGETDVNDKKEKN